MRAVVQRVSEASVSVDDTVVGQIGRGLLVLVGVAHGDGHAECEALVDKLVGLRVFADEEAKMNLSVEDVAGQILVVSQFTLLADVRKGRRPSFVGAAGPEAAEPLVEYIAELIRDHGINVETGMFGAMMKVGIVNDGPVTIVLEVVDGRVQ